MHFNYELLANILSWRDRPYSNIILQNAQRCTCISILDIANITLSCFSSCTRTRDMFFFILKRGGRGRLAYVTWFSPQSMTGVRAFVLLVPWVRKQCHVCSRLASTKRPRITASRRRQPMPWEITCLSPESQRTESKSTSAAHDLTVRGSFPLTHRKAPWPTKPIRVRKQATTNRRRWRAGRKRRRRRRWCCRRRRRSRCRGTVAAAGAFGACGIFTTMSLRITTNWSPKSKVKAILLLSKP